MKLETLTTFYLTSCTFSLAGRVFFTNIALQNTASAKPTNQVTMYRPRATVASEMRSDMLVFLKLNVILFDLSDFRFLTKYMFNYTIEHHQEMCSNITTNSAGNDLHKFSTHDDKAHFFSPLVSLTIRMIVEITYVATAVLKRIKEKLMLTSI